MKKTISFSIILVGFTAMASQIVFMREFLIAFYGNELSIGFVLAGWLAWGAAGSWLLGRAADRIKAKIPVFGLCQICLSILFPLSILAIRPVKLIFNLAAGEITPLSVTILSSFVILAPICGLLGFMFSLGCRIYQVQSHPAMDKAVLAGRPAAERIGKVYILEAVGSMIGGLLVSFILIRFLPSVHIIGILSLLNVSAAFLLQLFLPEAEPQDKLKRASIAISAVFLAAGISMWLFGGWDTLNGYSLKKQWEGYELLDSRNSIYSNITAVKKASQRSFFSNGLHLYTVPDKLTSEEAAHFALLEHPHPEMVLLVGGGVGGLIEEINKHPVKNIDYIELDPEILRMAKLYLPPEDYSPLLDKRVTIHNLDGRFFIKRAEGKYDCIIIHLADPYTAQLNRYYTVEFFREVKSILNPGGIVSFAVTSSENYISRELADFLSSIYFSLKEVFPDVKIIPGDTAYFIACTEKDILTTDYRILTARAHQRRLDVKYVRDYYLFCKLSAERINYIEGRLQKKQGEAAAAINYDFRPICYYYDVIFWTTHFSGSLFKKVLQAVTEKRIWRFILAAYLFIFLYGLSGAGPKRCKKIVLMAVMTTGFAEIVFQVAVLLSFQIIYGYVFYKIGLILTSFMIGLALGAWYIVRIMPRLKRDLDVFIRTQAAICVYPLLLPLLFFWFSGSKSDAVSWLGSEIVFVFLPIIAGFIGGFQFPLANKIYLADEGRIGRVAGLCYGMDLLGACLAAFLAGTFLIPLLGVVKTCLATGILSLVVLILLMLVNGVCPYFIKKRCFYSSFVL